MRHYTSFMAISGYSVIIPVFNRAHKLTRAVESAQHAATFATAPVEIIVIDDASSDGSAEVARSLGVDRVDRLSENLGVTGAKNRGIDLAANEWLVFLDSDDMLTADAFAKIERLLNESPKIDILFGACHNLSGVALISDPYEVGFWSYENMLLKGSPGEFLPVCRRKVFAEVRYVTELRGFEGVTWLTLARKGFQVYYSPRVLRLYDDTGSDRLCARNNLVRDTQRLANGFRHLLKEFGGDMAERSLATYLGSAIRYHFYSRIAGLPHPDCARSLQVGNFVVILEGVLLLALRIVPGFVLYRLWRS